MECDATVVLEAGARLGEGPIWDHRSGRLYWVNIPAGELHVFDPARDRDRTVEVGEPVGTVVPTRDEGRVLLALRQTFAVLDVETGESEVLADLADRTGGKGRFNDGKCDPRGRFWAGTVGQPDGGSLYCMEPGGAVSVKLTGVECSNGIVWNEGLDTMYYIDSPRRTVDAFNYDPGTGSIGNRRAVVRTPEDDSVPDGMAIDAEGMLWVAMCGGWAVNRYDPASGELLGSVRVPAAYVTACAFGGPDLEDLYITTATGGLEQSELDAHQPSAGGLFRARPGVRGATADIFGSRRTQ